MKILIFVLLIFIYNRIERINKIKKKKKIPDSTGLTQNDHLMRPLPALSYGWGNNSKHLLTSSMKRNYIRPSIIPTLKDFVYITPTGPRETIVEIKTYNNQYDGSVNPEKLGNSGCNAFSKDECLDQTTCGWCNNGSKCIKGNFHGPENKRHCDGSFIYSNL